MTCIYPHTAFTIHKEKWAENDDSDSSDMCIVYGNWYIQSALWALMSFVSFGVEINEFDVKIVAICHTNSYFSRKREEMKCTSSNTKPNRLHPNHCGTIQSCFVSRQNKFQSIESEMRLREPIQCDKMYCMNALTMCTYFVSALDF